MRLQWIADELVADRDLRVLDRQAHFYRATGSAPRLSLRPQLPAGWYMLEVALKLPSARTQGRIHIDCGDHEVEAKTLGFPLHSSRMAKRLIYLPRRGRLHFELLSCLGTFSIQHFRVVRVSKTFARSRMRRKLLNVHPRYKLSRSIPSGTRVRTLPHGEKILWSEYNGLFERRGDLLSYAEWIEQVEGPSLPRPALQAAEIGSWHWLPFFSIILPTRNSDPVMLRACLDSVLAQTYALWELCVANDASTMPRMREILVEYAERDGRLRVSCRIHNSSIVAARNSALELASGEFVVLLDPTDTLAPHALFAVAKALQQRPMAQLVYSDKDQLTSVDKRCTPYFKPDFSRDLLYSQDYFSHLGVYRRQLVQAVGGFRNGFESGSAYDLVLRCVARIQDDRDILHIPQVLYHRRTATGSMAIPQAPEPNDASEAGRRALQDHFDGLGLGVDVSVIAPGIYRHCWPLPEPAPLVSLIVPTRDGYDMLKICIESILRGTRYPRYEILVVDNQSTCERTLAYMAELSATGKVRVLRYDRPFNYSAINNFAAKQARGAIIGLINNDVEVINSEWLTEMVSHAARPEIGCVGAKLYYPDDTIQHAGVVCGLGVADHGHRHFPREALGYFGRLWTIYNPSAVTGAVLVLRKTLFESVGGLDEQGLPVAFNDVDLCLKVMAAGYRNLWTPFAELYHHESVSRGADVAPEKRARFLGECAVMRSRWRALLDNDPYYNPNLTRTRED
ncbi:MAG: glycosyltransferase family 2 protein, partial [Gammaproteobacteria bacterium]